MTSNSLTITIDVDRAPAEVFAAITDTRGWWTGDIDGPTDQLGAEFTYRYEDAHRSTQRITELIPGERVTWHVVDAHLAFASDPTEWTGTDIIFDIAPTSAGSAVRFTHVGLVPGRECFTDCASAWRYYIATSLRVHIIDGHR
jgi:hypothetical protein